MAGGKKITNADVSLVTDLFIAGLSISEIAIKACRSEASINSICYKNGLSFRARKRKTIDFCTLKKHRKDYALKRPLPEVTKQKNRLCLKCKEDFISFNAGNRLCSNCKSLNSGYVGVVYG